MKLERRRCRSPSRCRRRRRDGSPISVVGSVSVAEASASAPSVTVPDCQSDATSRRCRRCRSASAFGIAASVVDDARLSSAAASIVSAAAERLRLVGRDPHASSRPREVLERVVAVRVRDGLRDHGVRRRRAAGPARPRCRRLGRVGDAVVVRVEPHQVADAVQRHLDEAEVDREVRGRVGVGRRRRRSPRSRRSRRSSRSRHRLDRVLRPWARTRAATVNRLARRRGSRATGAPSSSLSARRGRALSARRRARRREAASPPTGSPRSSSRPGSGRRTSSCPRSRSSSCRTMTSSLAEARKPSPLTSRHSSTVTPAMPTSPEPASKTPLLSVAAWSRGCESDSSRHTWLPMRARCAKPKSTVWLERSSNDRAVLGRRRRVPSVSPVGSPCLALRRDRAEFDLRRCVARHDGRRTGSRCCRCRRRCSAFGLAHLRGVHAVERRLLGDVHEVRARREAR